MGTKPNRGSPTTRSRRRFPEYARKIRDFRKECGLTQPELAGELQTRRGAVARWEGATREPNEQNYGKLTDLALRRKLKSFEDFFSNQLNARKRARIRELGEREALRFSRSLHRMLKAGGVYAERLRELYRVMFADYIKDQVNRIANAHKTLSNGAFYEEISRMLEELLHVTELSVPGGLDMFRELVALDRQLDRLHSYTTEGTEAQEAKRREIERTLDRWGVLVRKGKIPGPGDLGNGVTESNLLKVLCAKVSKIAEEKRQADEEGKPFDAGEFINKLERALEIDRKAGKSDRQV